MEIKGSEQIAAPRAIVWRVLNDTTSLQPCIDGCEKLERVSENRIDAVLRVRLGLINLRFHGSLLLSDISPPVSYIIAGEGRGALSGLATGKTCVRLEEIGWSELPVAKRREIEKKGGQAAGRLRAAGFATRLFYHMHGTAGGKLAQFGSKMLGAVAGKIVARFFARLAAACEAEAERGGD
ncbi:MAG: carbon monoxide dehydrogenase [Candidatus Tokpelaia sp.]|nr:MAG: carbon monoxide dehydrogenase [Candidatus Tokpelaia sp.]KAA6207482.1 MAG: carbon monoxide dehydrogenase [Candidatus Tokpelaia sp.]